MSRIKVGIPGWMTGERSFGISISYAQFIQNFFNGEIHILSPEREVRKDLDLLLLPGGADIQPARYGAYPSFETSNPNLLLEHFDTEKLPRYIDSRTPIFGICRGMQSLAVHFGAKMNQDMWHETNESHDKGKTVHEIIDLVTAKKLKVNSRHHQTIRLTEESSNNVKLDARHVKDHSIEAIHIHKLPIFAVQFHPEDMYDMNTLHWLKSKLTQYEII